MLDTPQAAEAALRDAVPAEVFKEVGPAYLEEPRGRWTGHAALLALPRDVDEVAALVRTCAAHGLPIVPYGGGTGLVGGQLTGDGAAPLVLSLERMTAIRDVLPEENVLVCEAGAILADVQAAAQDADRLFPLSLASEGSARIGGLLATNAGGVGVLRYGNARDLCLGVEAVLPSGEIYRGLTRLRKDNTGYDLRNLLIGSEGTLGIITAAALKLSPRPESEAAAVLSVPSPEAALTLLSLARAQLAEGISAFEIISGEGLRFLAHHMPEIRQPLDPAPDWSVLIDIGLSGGLDSEAALGRLFETAFERDLVTDGVIAQSLQQRAEFWSVREHIPLANRQVGAIASHDVSLPLSEVAGFIAEMPTRLAEIAEIRINCFGHLGDGNLHYNLFPAEGRRRDDYDNEKSALSRAVHDAVAARGGSISAEHGIGRLKVDDLERYGDPAKLNAMRAIKATLDPAGIMNPGAILRPPA